MRHRWRTMRNGPRGWKLKASGFCGSGIQRSCKTQRQFRKPLGPHWMTVTVPPPQSSPARGEEEEDPDQRLERELRQWQRGPRVQGLRLPGACGAAGNPFPPPVPPTSILPRTGGRRKVPLPPVRGKPALSDVEGAGIGGDCSPSAPSFQVGEPLALDLQESHAVLDAELLPPAFAHPPADLFAISAHQRQQC